MARLRGLARSSGGAQALAAAGAIVVCPHEYFAVEPVQLFGRDAPLEIEIGCGRGEFIIARAAAMPERNFLAVEAAGKLAQILALRAGQARLANLGVLRMDARPLVNLFLSASSVSAYHVYFPDPWPKRRQAKHRLFTPGFVGNLAHTLIAGAPLYLATDVVDYAEAICAMAAAAGLHPISLPVPGAAETPFARKFVAEGRTILCAALVK